MFFYYLLTQKCNLACRHCIRGTGRSTDMDLGAALAGLVKIKDFDKDATIVLTGGEPTIYPQFMALAEHALGLFGEVIVTSNGTTPFFHQNAKALKKLCEKGLRIQFSLDGDEQAHDAMRGPGSWRKAMDNMDSLAAEGIVLWVSTVVTSDNMASMERLRDELIRRRAQKWHVSQVLPFGCGKGLNTPDREEWNSFVDRMLDSVPFKLGIKKLFDFTQLERLSDEDIERLAGIARKRKLMNCGSGTQKLYVYPDLTVSGCTCISQIAFGNLGEQSLKDILSSPNANAIRYYKLRKDSPCRSCRFVPLCNGGCIGMSVNVEGKPGMGDPRCPYWQKFKKAERSMS